MNNKSARDSSTFAPTARKADGPVPVRAGAQIQQELESLSFPHESPRGYVVRWQPRGRNAMLLYLTQDGTYRPGLQRACVYGLAHDAEVASKWAPQGAEIVHLGLAREGRG